MTAQAVHRRYYLLIVLVSTLTFQELFGLHGRSCKKLGQGNYFWEKLFTSLQRLDISSYLMRICFISSQDRPSLATATNGTLTMLVLNEYSARAFLETICHKTHSTHFQGLNPLLDSSAFAIRRLFQG